MRFNVALLPPENIARAAVVFAQDNFSSVSDGYCLSDAVLPHITLVQFEVEAELAGLISSKIQFLFTPEIIRFCGFHVREGTGRHDGFCWIEIMLKKEKALLGLHRDVVEILNGNGLIPLNSHSEHYHPHLTLARVPKCNLGAIGHFQAQWMKQPEVAGCSLAVGLSDENGQYLKTIA